MSTLYQIVIGVLAALIVSLLGLLLRAYRRQVTSWRARAWWRPFASGHLKIITGDLTRVYPDLGNFEAGGLIGVGDVQAAAELAAFFGRLGFPGFDPSKDIVRGNRPPGELYGLNLICIGGADANEATEKMLAKISPTLEGGPIRIRDAAEGKVYEPTSSLDYGVLIKARNPLNDSREVLIIDGCSGYGTWAGVKLACSPRFRKELHDRAIPPGQPIECLYSTDVINGVPLEPRVVVVRSLPF